MHWIYVEPDVCSSWALWRFYSVILWWQHLFFLHNFLLVCCVIICWPWTFSTAAVDRREKPVSFKLNHSHRCWCLFLTFIVLLIYSSHLINWKGCSKTSFLNMSLMGPKSHLRWAIFSSFGRFNLLTLSQGHREVCHFQGRDTFFGVFLLLRVPRDSGRELEDFCHLSAAFIKIFDLSLKLRRRFPQVDVSCCLISHLLSSSPHYRFSSVTIRYDIRLP